MNDIVNTCPSCGWLSCEVVGEQVHCPQCETHYDVPKGASGPYNKTMLYITYCIEEFDGIGSAVLVSDDKIEVFFRDEIEVCAEFEEAGDEVKEAAVREAMSEFADGARYGTPFSVTLGGHEHHFETLNSTLTEAYMGPHLFSALKGFIEYNT